MLPIIKFEKMNFVDKIKVKFKKPKKVETLEIIDSKCVGCGMCVKMCKREVFGISDTQAFVANFEACVGCGKCVNKMCNYDAIKLVLA